MTSQRSAIVTGASGGIGMAIARMLANEGHSLTLSGRNTEKLEGLKQDIQAASKAEVQIVAGSVADPTYLRELVDAHAAAFGDLDVLVNNAGIVLPKSIEEETDEDIDGQLDTNLRATIMMTRNAIPHLLSAADKRGKAHVFNTASNAGLRGELTLASYSASKAGVIGYTQVIHQEYSMRGIRATAICPGLTDSSMTEIWRDQVSQDEMVDPRDIAEGVRFAIRCNSNCIIPELTFLRNAEWLDQAPEHME